MKSFSSLNCGIIDVVSLFALTIILYYLIDWLYPKYINFAKKKGWTGRDIHKKDRPEVAESGGIPFVIGVVIACVVIILLYPSIRNQTIVFGVTVLWSAAIGFYDDRKILNSYKKLMLIALSGVPFAILNWFGYIRINSIIIPFIGQTQLTIIYPLLVPIILMVLTNAFNMLEGYNGEGSGSTLIVIIFLIIISIIAGIADSLIYSIAVLGPLIAFVKYNKFPAKVFPGDVGTLALGAIVAVIALFGSIEVAMFGAILVHVFNGFYVLASIGSLKERHTITTKDIYLDENDVIHPTTEMDDHLTLPRLIVAEKPMREDDLVKNIWALTVIGGIFGLISEVAKQWTLANNTYGSGPIVDFWNFWYMMSFIIGFFLYLPIIIKFHAIRGISFFMIAVLGLGALIVMFIDIYIVDFFDFQSNWLSWIILICIALIGFVLWYIATIKYFWWKISKASGSKIDVPIIPHLKKQLNEILEKFLHIELKFLQPKHNDSSS